MGKLVCFALLLTTACGDAIESHAVSTAESVLSTVERRGEEPLWALADEHPAFGGYYCDDGKIVGLIANDAEDFEAESQALASSIAPWLVSACRRHHQLVPDPGGIEIRRTRYRFTSLRGWRNSITYEFLDQEGAVSLGVDYIKNKIVLGISSNDYRARTDELLSSHGVPTDAYEVALEGPTAEEAACPNPSSPNTVYSCFRPYVPGGVTITTKPNGGDYTNGAGCTLGPTAYRWDGVWFAGWVTNSHCVGHWGNQSGYVYQPTSSTPSENMIGFESIDPPGYACGSRTCRHSDAAWIQSLSVLPAEGLIVRPIGWSTVGQVNVYPPSAVFTVDTWTWSVQNQEIEKVGNASGWTTGIVKGVCVDHAMSGTTRTLLCNDRASYAHYNGDSGSPVFTWGYNGDHVTLNGVHWGEFGGWAAYSQWAWVINDLGNDFWITP